MIKLQPASIHEPFVVNQGYAIIQAVLDDKVAHFPAVYVQCAKFRFQWVCANYLNREATCTHFDLRITGVFQETEGGFMCHGPSGASYLALEKAYFENLEPTVRALSWAFRDFERDLVRKSVSWESEREQLVRLLAL